MLQMLLSEVAKKLVDEKLKDHKKRLTHVYGVCEMAEELAKRYNVDIEKARVAALMHDYSKYDDPIENEYMLSYEEKEECKNFPFLYHAYFSAYNYKKLFDNYDMDIFNAIHNHVFGRPNMSILEAIIMISDFTEKNRTYDDCIKCREILLNGDMDMAIYESLVATQNVCIKNNNPIHPIQEEVLREYERKVKNR